jgi:hypothetical protein
MAKKQINTEEVSAEEILPLSVQEKITPEEQAHAEATMEENVKRWNDGLASRGYRSPGNLPTPLVEETPVAEADGE